MTNCKICEKVLSGKQTMYCSSGCKSKGNYGSYTQQKERGLRRKKDFIEIKGGGCEKCGYNKSLRVLSFHHRNPKDKSFGLEIRNITNKPYDILLEEVNKCDLLCANCHMELHDNE